MDSQVNDDEVEYLCGMTSFYNGEGKRIVLFERPDRDGCRSRFGNKLDLFEHRRDFHFMGVEKNMLMSMRVTVKRRLVKVRDFRRKNVGTHTTSGNEGRPPRVVARNRTR